MIAILKTVAPNAASFVALGIVPIVMYVMAVLVVPWLAKVFG